MDLSPIPAGRYELCGVGGCGNSAIYDGLVPGLVDGVTSCFEVTVCADHKWPDDLDCRDYIEAHAATSAARPNHSTTAVAAR